jgi:CRISPR-associated protein Cas1
MTACAKCSIAPDALMPSRDTAVRVKINRKILALRKRGLSHREIASQLGVAKSRVQNTLDAAKPAKAHPFVMRERDADYAAIDAALARGSNLRAEYARYASRVPHPLAFGYFATRFTKWRAAQKSANHVFAEVSAPSSDDLPKSPIRPNVSRVSEQRTSKELASLRASPANMSESLPVYLAQDRAAPFDYVGVAPLERGVLFLSDPGVALQVRKSALAVRHGNGVERTFPRGRHGVRAIIITAVGASLTTEAMRWIMSEDVALFVMHSAGEALALLTNAPTTNADTRPLQLRRAQFSASPSQRLEIARAILAAKIRTSELPEHDVYEALRNIAKACSHENLLLAEASAAREYWKRYIGFELKLSGRAPVAWAVFRGRLEKHGTQHIPRWARTPHNAALNYAYAVTLGNVTRALVGLGADPCYGFVHHFDKPQRLSLSYDCLELLRAKVDACVFRWLESRSFDRADFIELNSQVLLSQRLAREVAMRVLADVTREECEKAARAVAGLIMSETNQTK